MDSKGRIVIPEDVRKELGLNEGSRIRVRLEKSSVNSGTVVILTKSVGTGRVHQADERGVEEAEPRKSRRPAPAKGDLGRDLVDLRRLQLLDILVGFAAPGAPARDEDDEQRYPRRDRHEPRDAPRGRPLPAASSQGGVRRVDRCHPQALDAHPLRPARPAADPAPGTVPEHADEGLGSRERAILATMRNSGVRKIATHDPAFLAVKGIEVVDSIPRRA